jgi:transcription elongation factor Elf1
MKIKPCPYCKDYHDESNELLVETHVDNFENSQSIECGYCGLRGMSADIQDDGMTIKLWNDLVNAIEKVMA